MYIYELFIYFRGLFITVTGVYLHLKINVYAHSLIIHLHFPLFIYLFLLVLTIINMTYGTGGMRVIDASIFDL